MFQKIAVFFCCIFLVLGTTLSVAGRETAGSLPVDTHSDTGSGSSAAAAPPESDAPPPVPILTKDSADQSAGPHDSTAHAIIAAMEREAAMKAREGEEVRDREVRARSVSDRIIGIMHQVPREAGRHRWLALAMAAVAVISIFALAVMARRRAGREVRRFMTTTRLSLMNGEVQRACLHIEKNYGDPLLSPQSVCAAIITGEPFLETLFEKELGMGVSAYINQVRIHRAKLLVAAATETTGMAVALRVGFPDERAFEKQFKLVDGRDFAAFCREKQSPS